MISLGHLIRHILSLSRAHYTGMHTYHTRVTHRHHKHTQITNTDTDTYDRWGSGSERCCVCHACDGFTICSSDLQFSMWVCLRDMSEREMCVWRVCVRSLIAQPSPSQDHFTHNAPDVPVSKMNTVERNVPECDKCHKLVGMTVLIAMKQTLLNRCAKWVITQYFTSDAARIWCRS